MKQQKFRLGSIGIVVLILGALALWMFSGLLSHKGGPDTADAAQKAAVIAAAKPAFTVQARVQGAEKVRRLVQANGDTRPDQIIDIASQVEGQVMEVGPRKGARVKAGELLVRIDTRDLEAQKAEAQAMTRTRELEYASATKLRETGYVTESQLASKLADLETARAALKVIELRMLGLKILAPVSGILEDRKVETGSYVKIGETVVRLIKLDPLIISGGVNESDIRWIRLGAPAEAEVLGRKLQGKVRFVASMADPQTRSFTVEVAVDNPDSATPAGSSARLVLPVEEVLAQRIPTSLLSLADNGGVGVKYVVDGKVVFAKASIVRADGDAVYVGGLPEQITLITRGQGFVAAGEAVTVELEKPAAVAAGQTQ